MARVQMGVIVVGLRGTVGGLTFSANRAGPHCHVWTRSGNARTALQSGRRVIHTVNAQAWRNLDPGDQADWNTWGATVEIPYPWGGHFHLSGFQWYVKNSNWLASVGRPPVNAPTLSIPPVAPTITALQVSASASTCHFHYGLNEFGPDYDAVIMIGLAAGHGCYAAPGPVPLIQGSQVPAGTSLDFTTRFFEVFGAVTTNQRAFYRVYRQRVWGYRGAPATGYVDVIP